MQSVSRRNLAPLPGPANEINIHLSFDKSFKTLNSYELSESKSDFSETKSGTDLSDEICNVFVRSVSHEFSGAS